MPFADFLIPPTLDAKQALRLRRFGLAALSYTLCTALVGVAWTFELLDSTSALTMTLAIVVINLVTYAVLRSGLNLRFRDPSLTQLQILLAITILMLLIYNMNEGRVVALLACFIVFPFGVYNLSTRKFAIVTLYTLVAYSAVILGLMLYRPTAIENLALEWMSWLMLAVILPCFALVGGQINSLRLQLREREARFRNLTQLSSDFYWETDAMHRISSSSHGSQHRPVFPDAQQMGKARWEVPAIYPDEAGWAAHRATLDAHKLFRNFEVGRFGPDGKERHLSISGEPIFDASGAFRGYRGIGRDFTERKRAEQAMARQARQQGLMADFGQQALANAPLEQLFDQAVLATARGLDTVYARVLQMGPDGLNLMLRSGTGWKAGSEAGERNESTSRYAHLAGSADPVITGDFAVETRFSPSPLLVNHHIRSAVEVAIGGANSNLGVLGAYATRPHHFALDSMSFLQSIANTLATAIERERVKQRLIQLAQFDALTGLPNRSLFMDRFAQTLSQSQRNGWKAGVMFVDLDRFKSVNDRLGHGIGDQLLMETSRRLLACVRSVDTVARLGGDEFAIVLSDLTRPDDAALLAQKVVASIARTYELGGQEVHVSASVGVSIYPDDGTEADLLLKNSDTAMYRAKEQGSNNYQFYLPHMNETAMARLAMEAELRGALQRDEFLLHYQPKVDIASGSISGFEALLRWQHPARGLVPPLEFISVLEDTGLIVPVGAWVVHSVCQQLAVWQVAGVLVRPVAVNLSARQFHQRDLDAMIGQILHDTGVDPRLLEFELTESMLMHDPDAAAGMLRNLKARGVRLSVDDFGTGYSSLSYLKRFSLDALKIDRAFIHDVTTDADDATIAVAIISLAHNLKLKVVAEGVETVEQLAFLRSNACDEMQGFLFARPLALDDATRALTECWSLGPHPGDSVAPPAMAKLPDGPP